MPSIVTPADMQAVTAPFLDKIAPDESPQSREDALVEDNTVLRRQLSESNAKLVTAQMELAMAMDALRELAGWSAATLVAIEGEVPV